MKIRERTIGIIAISVAIIFFIAGFLYSWNFLNKQLSENQFQMCERIVQEMNEQNFPFKEGSFIIEENSEKISIDITATTITAKFCDDNYRGYVVGETEKNGEFLVKRYEETGNAIFESMLMGGYSILGIIIIILILCYIIVKVMEGRCKLCSSNQIQK